MSVNTENKGFTRVDNYFLDHVMRRVSGAEWKVVCAVLRMTVGYQKQDAQITVDEFMSMTGYERQAVIAAVRNVVLRTVVERRSQQAGRQRTFRFRAVPRANLKELPNPEPGRRQSALPFDVLQVTEFENQTPTAPFGPVEKMGQKGPRFENQTPSRSLKIKLRSSLTEFENQTSIESSPNYRFKERSLTTERSLAKESKNAFEKTEREQQAVENLQNEVVELCRFCQKQHHDPADSPAVTLYRDRFKLMPNEGFRHDIWVTVQDLLLWSEIIEGWWYRNKSGRRIEKNPLGINRMLSTYDEKLREQAKEGAALQ